MFPAVFWSFVWNFAAGSVLLECKLNWKSISWPQSGSFVQRMLRVWCHWMCNRWFVLCVYWSKKFWAWLCWFEIMTCAVTMSSLANQYAHSRFRNSMGEAIGSAIMSPFGRNPLSVSWSLLFETTTAHNFEKVVWYHYYPHSRVSRTGVYMYLLEAAKVYGTRFFKKTLRLCLAAHLPAIVARGRSMHIPW